MISAMDMVKGVKGTPRHRLQESTAPVQFGVTRLEEVVPACRPGGRRDGVPDSPFGAKRGLTFAEQSRFQLEFADGYRRVGLQVDRECMISNNCSVAAAVLVGVSACGTLQGLMLE